MTRIILLDLNYTLVSNSDNKASPFTRQIAQEEYRNWLVALARRFPTVLITARPSLHERATLARIHAKTGWTPDLACFNHMRLPPPNIKEWHMRNTVIPRFGAPGAVEYVGIESNSQTRAMYARCFGINSYKADDVLRGAGGLQ